MLNLQKLSEEHGYIVTDCEWYIINNGISTRLEPNGLYYSVDPKGKQQLEADAIYRFELITQNHGRVSSTNGVIGSQAKSASLLAFPNPIQSGGTLTIEGITEGSPLQVFNQAGMCVINTVATGNPVTINLNVPAGLYVIRTKDGEIKIVVNN